MRIALFRFATTIAFALAFVAPQVASADALTADQMTALNNGTKSYFRAVYNLDYAALKGLTAPGFQIVNKDGKPIGDKVAAQVQTAKMTIGNVSGGIRVISATMNGDTVTENVSMNAKGQSVGGSSATEATGRSLSTQHVLTWTKSPDGKWLLAKDQVLSAHTGSM
jgi:ketosteroid isomerase-like protein